MRVRAIATKGGLTRQGPNRWAPVGRPEYLRQCVELSLRRLALDRIDLYYLHRIDPQVPLADQLGALADLQREGKIRHIGLSKVTVDQIEQATTLVTVAAVQNRCHLATDPDPALAHCEAAGIGYVPYAPLGAGALLRPGGSLDLFARTHGTTPARLALAWLLHTSAVTLPIPGSASLAHLDDNLGADSTAIPTRAIEAATRAFRYARDACRKAGL